MKEIIVNVDNYNENSIKTIEGDNLSEVYKIYICKNKRRIDLTNKIAIMAYVNEYGNKKSNILALNITNAAEGEIELPITNIISEHNGVYACQVAIYGENNSLEQTAPFSLIVENNIFSKISNAAINSSDFHILSEAIKTTNAYCEKLKEGTENIELQYANKLNEKMNKDDVLSMTNMGQDVKEAMSGGSVAVVGVDAVDSVNLRNESVNELKTNFTNGVRNLVKKINKGFYIANTDGKINPVEHNEYSYVVIDVTGKMKITSSIGVSNNFSYVADSKDNILGKIEEYRLREKSGYRYIMPANASKLYMCSSSLTNDEDIVVLNSDIDIATKRYSFRDFPYDELVKIEIPKLFVPGVGFLKEHLLKGIDYSNIGYVNKNYLKTLRDLKSNSITGSRVDFINNTINVTILSQYGGILTEKFNSISDALKIVVEGTKNVETLDINIRYYNSEGVVKNIITKSLGNQFSETFTIDCSSLAVYNDAQSFDVLIITSNSSGTFKITKFEILEPNEMQKNEIYDDTLPGIVDNIQRKFNDVDNKINQSEKTLLTSPNGTKYLLTVSNDGTLKAVSLMPNKIIIAGNSLVNGMNDKDGTTFGMCASSNKKDFFAHVKNYILSKNNKANFSRLQIAPFEQAESLEAQKQVWSNLNSKFTHDTDLIILQIGDNVNNPTREEMFKTGFETFLNNIQTNCPKARILLVGCWFDVHNETTNVMKEIANKIGIELILINDLYTTENQGHEGQEITWSDGSTTVVNSRYITHPGDLGMKKIADRIINTLGF